MALGLIQFLLGGKNKKAASKNKESSNSSPNSQENNSSNNANQEASQNNSQDAATSSSNNANSNTNSNQQTPEQNQSSAPSQNRGNKKSVSEVLMKMHKEMKESNERLTTVVTDVKKIENSVNSLTNRVDAIEKKDVEKEKKLKEIDSNMGQFLSLYELINNQYNPFVSKEDMPKMEVPSQKEEEQQPEENSVSPIEVETSELENQKEENLQDNSNGTALEFAPENNASESDQKNEKPKEEVKTITLPQEEKPKPTPMPQKSEEKQNHKMSQSLLELDTLNIEEAAADAVPLTKLKNNTNALVIILSWLEFLIKRVGIEETRNTLRYYTETLRWMTPEVFFDLDKYLKGMSDNVHPQNSKTNVKDHIVSLYFISKLNEKSLDHRLTKAVLEIIEQ